MAMSTIQSPIIWTPRYKLCDVIFTILKKYLMGENIWRLQYNETTGHFYI